MKACPYVYIKTGELLQSKCLYAQCMAYVPEVDTKLVNPNDKSQTCFLLEINPNDFTI